MSSYGPPGGQQYPQQPQQYPQPQYETLQYGGPPPPPRRGPSPWLIGGIVGGVVVAVVVAGLVVNSLVRSEPSQEDRRPLTIGSPADGGQVKQLTSALTAAKMECSTRFTTAGSGQAGCFQWTDRGRTQSAIRFQYDDTGAVTAINAQSDKAAALKPLIAATAGVVFAADQDAVNQAVGTDRGKFDGSWGSYNAGTGSITRFVAGKSGTSPLLPPTLNATTTSSEVATALEGKGFTCDDAKEDCKSTFTGYNNHKGDLAVRTSGIGSGGISYLLVSVADTSKDATEQGNYDAFAGVIKTAFEVVQGPGTAEVQNWLTKHTDGESHTAYVAGWRVEIITNYGSPSEPNLPGYLRATMFTDGLWTTPDQ